MIDEQLHPWRLLVLTHDKNLFHFLTPFQQGLEPQPMRSFIYIVHAYN
jgi:hypothetical protein